MGWKNQGRKHHDVGTRRTTQRLCSRDPTRPNKPSPWFSRRVCRGISTALAWHMHMLLQLSGVGAPIRVWCTLLNPPTILGSSRQRIDISSQTRSPDLPPQHPSRTSRLQNSPEAFGEFVNGCYAIIFASLSCMRTILLRSPHTEP